MYWSPARRRCGDLPPPGLLPPGRHQEPRRGGDGQHGAAQHVPGQPPAQQLDWIAVLENIKSVNMLETFGPETKQCEIRSRKQSNEGSFH